MKKLILLFSIFGITLTRAQTIIVTQPSYPWNYDYSWYIGYSSEITWVSTAVSYVNIDYSSDSGQTWKNIITGTPATAGQYLWSVPGPMSPYCFIRISDSENPSTYGLGGPFIMGMAGFVGLNPNVDLCNNSSVFLIYPADSIGNTYSWSPTSGLSNPQISNPIASPDTTTTYTVTVTTALNQVTIDTIRVTVLPSPVLNLVASSNVANYFKWDTVYPVVTPSEQCSFDWFYEDGFQGYNQAYFIQENGEPDTILCVATNDLGCFDSATFVIQGSLNIQIDSIHNVHCLQDSSGYIGTTVTGGTGSYIYEWAPATVYNSAFGPSIANLPAGVYYYLVYDGNGDIATATIDINMVNPLLANEQLYLYDNFPDSIVLNPTGGTPPYLFVWNNGSAATQQIINASGGYDCTVSDSKGCLANTFDTIGVITNDDTYQAIENYANPLPVLQNDLLTNEINWFWKITQVSTPANGTAGVWPYYPSYGSNIVYTPSYNYTGADSFYYIVCLSDSTGPFDLYCDTAMVRVNVIDSLSINFGFFQNTNFCPGICNNILEVIATGGARPLTYEWSNGQTTDTAINLCWSGSISVTVTDANNLVDSIGATSLYYTNSLTIINDTLWAVAPNPQQACTFSWSTGAVDSNTYASFILIPHPGIYCVTISNDSCTFSICDTTCVNCVWPGDANYDGIANMYDLLFVGLGYGDTGTVRPGASDQWTGQPCADWAYLEPTGTDFKHADCNGDGIIDANDTVPILLNYGLTHSRSGDVRQQRNGLPSLSVSLSPDTLQNGETMIATFSLGNASLPGNDIYGLAFTFNYDPELVDSTKTQVAFGDSWLGTASDKISITKDFSSAGQMECALTRIDHATRSGNGPIGQAQFTITSNGKNPSYMQTWISNLEVIDNMGNVLQFNEGADTAIIENYPAGIQQINIDASIKIFPNPVHEQLIIRSQNQLAMQEITLIDLPGNIVLRQTVTRPYQTTVDVSSLSSGAYFARIETTGGTVMKKFVVE